MIQNINPAADLFLASVNQLQAKAQTDEMQLSSGLRVNKPSDDPTVVSDILQINSSQARNTQIGENLNVVSGVVNVASGALSTAVTTLDQVSSLAAEGASSTVSATTRTQLAAQVQDQLQNLIGNADSSVGGRYVFAGNADGTIPYTLDLSQPNGVSAYAGSQATDEVEDPRGGSFPASQTAQQIFDAPGASVFAAVNSLRVALTNNDTTGITTAIQALNTAQSALNSSLSYYGNVQNELTEATAASQTIGLQLSTNLSNVQDADAAAAASNLTQTNLQLQAAFASEAKYPNTTLFNFLTQA